MTNNLVQACEQVLWRLSNIKVIFLWLFIYEAHVLKRSRLWFHMTRLRCITSKMRNIIEKIIIERYVGSKISKDCIVAIELFMKAKLYKESKQSIWEWDMVCCIYMVSNWLSLLVMRNIGRNGFHSWFKCDTSLMDLYVMQVWRVGIRDSVSRN